jgi:hypothetical protein
MTQKSVKPAVKITATTKATGTDVGRRPRRPMSYYEDRAKKMGLPSLCQPVEGFPGDPPRGKERL